MNDDISFIPIKKQEAQKLNSINFDKNVRKITDHVLYDKNHVKLSETQNLYEKVSIKIPTDAPKSASEYLLHSKLKSLKEAQERKAQLRRENKSHVIEEQAKRARYEEEMSSNRRRNKIKSKGFHKHLKRKQMKQEMNEKNLTSKTKADLLLNKEEIMEKERILERMTQKCRSGGKYTKLKLLAKTDPHARQRLADIQDKAQKLLNQRKDVSSDENEDQSSQSDPEMVTADVDNEQLALTALRGETIEEFLNKHDKGTTKRTEVHVNDKLDDSDDEEIDENTLMQFRDDLDELSDAEAEKRKKAEKPKFKMTSGINNWCGKRFKCEVTEKIEEPEKKEKAHVLLNSDIPDCTKKHLVTKVPYPYNTKEQFDLAHSMLITRRNNLEIVARALCKPKRQRYGNKTIYPRKLNK